MENFPGSPKYNFKHWAYVRPIFKTKYHLSSWESLIPDYFDPIIKYNAAVPQITWFYFTKKNSNIAPFFPFFLFSDMKSDIKIGNVGPSWNQALPKDQFWYQIWYQQKTFTYIRTLNLFLVLLDMAILEHKTSIVIDVREVYLYYSFKHSKLKVSELKKPEKMFDELE